MSNQAQAVRIPAPEAGWTARCDAESIAPYVEDAGGMVGSADAVLMPADEAQVVAILREAARTGTPVTLSGAGTGLTGGRVARGGWVVSTERLNRIVEMAPGRTVVQPGVLLKEVQAAAQAGGQFYPPDPTENHSSIGGNIANNASGSRSFKYGSTRRWVERLRVVLANGDVLDLPRGRVMADATGRFHLALSDGEVREICLPDARMPATTKHSAGYYFAPCMDLVDLFIGSEGTLGIVTEAALRLIPSPGNVLGGVIFFGNERAALDFVSRVRRLSRDSHWEGPLQARLLEFFCYNSLTLLRLHRYPEVPLAARAAVLLEQEVGDGSPEDAADRWLEVIGENGALLDESWFAISPAEREKFREFRHAIALIVNDTARANGFPKLGTDQAVPIERTEDILNFYRAECEAVFAGAHPPQYTIYGHIGDGHLHVNMLPAREETARKTKALLTKFAMKAVELGGTVGAEHGLGKSKAHYLRLLYPPEVIEAMWNIKLALDPQNLLNRGNLFTTSDLLQE